MNTQALDQSVQDLQAHKDHWAQLPAARRLDYLDGVIRRYPAVAARQVSACNSAKGIDGATPRGGEEWAHPCQTMRLLRLLRASLGAVQFPKHALRSRPDGQLIAQVFPLSAYDRLLFRRFRGEVWMQPGVTAENLTLRHELACGTVSLVLGAGNVASVGAGDLIHKLFVENQVCLFKHNPVVDYLAPILDEAFSDLIRDGFLRFASGGSDVGDYLCRHPGIDEIHLTGSDRTYEAIVFGHAAEGRERKQANRPLLAKRFTCELGNATPVIVAPGRWSDSDIHFHAENIVTQMVVNGGFNCLSARVLILHKDWPQARDLIGAIRSLLATIPQRIAYYPGAESRYDEVMRVNPHAQPIGPRSSGVLPYTLVPDIDPADRGNPCFATECFMPVLAQTSLAGSDAAEFLNNAVEFSNRTLWGTLSGSIVIHPEVERQLGKVVEDTIARMRYGTVSLNQWTGLGYAWGSTSWGAFPGHTPIDIQSGIGAVHNSFLFAKPEKSVVYGPFRMWPKPAWFVTNPHTHTILRRMFELETNPTLSKALRVAWAAIGG